MKWFTKNVRGSISLFLSMIILLLVILEGFLIDGSRILAGKTFLSGAGELSLNAGLTYYDKALMDIYGLFANCKTEEELKQNLKGYFQKTLGEITGNADTSGYVDELLEYVNTAIESGWNGEDPSKIILLKTGNFSMKGVPGSELSNPAVMKSQILEYMKYRGPASLGYGMLEKLFAFKDLNKQQKALEKKLDYEEEMSEVQDACEKAYEKLNEYKELLEKDMSPASVQSKSLFCNSTLINLMMETWCYSALMKEFQEGAGNNGILENWDADLPEVEAVRQDVEAACNRCPTISGSGENSLEIPAGFAETYLLTPGTSSDKRVQGTAAAVKIALGYAQDYENYKRLHREWLQYQKYYEETMDELTDENEDGEADAEIEALQEEYEKYKKCYEEAKQKIARYARIFKDARNVLADGIGYKLSFAVELTKETQEAAERLETLGEESIEALEQIKKEMQELKKRGEAWEAAIGKLSDGDVKTSMDADRQSKSEEMKEEYVDALITRIENGISYGSGVRTAAENTKFLDLTLYTRNPDDYTSAGEVLSIFNHKGYGDDTDARGIPYRSFSMEDWTRKGWGTKSPQTSYLSKLVQNGTTVFFLYPGEEAPFSVPYDSIVEMGLSEYKTLIDEKKDITPLGDAFYEYLERLCPKSETEETTKETAKEARKELFEQGKVDTSVEALPGLPADVTGASGSGAGSFENPSTNENDDKKFNKNISSSTKSNNQSSAGFLEQVGKLLTDGRDKLYLSEYATQMFSYYTVDVEKDSKGNPVTRTTLSGRKFSADSNAMYKAEVEYILWGNPSGQKDVQYTLSTIFGIRFLLNTLYAFTGDPEIAEFTFTLATAIAGWTGFGVPLVQSVITIGLALAETARDVELLKKGESVPIYKNQSTWCIKPSGITKEVVQTAVHEAVSSAQNYVFEQLDQLTENTKGAFSSELDKFSEETVDNIVSTATATVLDPLRNLSLSLSNTVVKDEAYVKGRIDDVLDGLSANIGKEENLEDGTASIMKQVKLKAVEYMKGRSGDFASFIIQYQNQSVQEMTEFVNKKLKDYKKGLKTTLTNIAYPLVSEAKNGVNQALDSANGEIQKRTSEAMDKMMMKIDNGIMSSGLPDGKTSYTARGEGGKTSLMLTMNYREYLWLFIAVKSIQSEEDMLKRMGNLIQANLTATKNQPSPDFKINSAYTFLELKADADISTAFFAIPVPTVSGGGVKMGQGSYKISYHGVLGY